MSELHNYNSYIEFLKAESKERKLDNLSSGILDSYYKNRQLQSENGRLRESLEDMVCQFAFWGNGGLMTGGLSALELAFDVLGWNEPHEMKSMQCDEPKCKERASCGWPSKGGYRNTCSKHMQNLKETEE